MLCGWKLGPWHPKITRNTLRWAQLKLVCTGRKWPPNSEEQVGLHHHDPHIEARSAAKLMGSKNAVLSPRTNRVALSFLQSVIFEVH